MVLGGASAGKNIIRRYTGRKVITEAKRIWKEPTRHAHIERDFFRAIARITPSAPERRLAQKGVGVAEYFIRTGTRKPIPKRELKSIKSINKYRFAYEQGLKRNRRSRFVGTPVYLAGVHDSNRLEGVLWRMRISSDAAVDFPRKTKGYVR